MQPRRIVIDIPVHLLPGIKVQILAVRQQDAGIAGDGSQRCPQIMGNGAKQIRPELFTLRLELGFFLFRCVAAVLQSKSTLAKNRQQHTVLKGFQGLAALDNDGTVDSVLDLDGIVQSITAAAGSHPRKDRSMTVQQLGYLGSDCLEDFIVRGGFLQHLTGFKQKIRAVGRLGGLLDLTFQPVRQGADNQSGNNHDQKCQRGTMLIYPQRKLWCGEKEIEYQHTANGGKDIAAAGGCDHRGQQSRQQINCNDIGLCEAHLRKAVADGRCQNQNSDGQRPVPESGFQIDSPFCFLGLVASIHAGIRYDMDIQIWGDSRQLLR